MNELPLKIALIIFAALLVQAMSFFLVLLINRARAHKDGSAANDE